MVFCLFFSVAPRSSFSQYFFFLLLFLVSFSIQLVLFFCVLFFPFNFQSICVPCFQKFSNVFKHFKKFKSKVLQLEASHHVLVFVFHR